VSITDEIGIPIVTDVTVTDLIAENGGGTVSHIATSRGLITVDRDTDVMLCAGAQTADLLRLIGYYVPLVGLKGYALRVPLTPAQASRLPTKTVVDGHLYASVMSNTLVCSSGGEFDGGDVVVRPEPVRALRDEAKKLFPSVPAGAIDAGQVVAGFRPLTANFAFLVGRIANDSNVFVSTGQGFHGAKLSLGCAVLAARAVVGAQALTSLPIDHFLAHHHIKHAPFFCRWARALTIN
jgi:D-amino-acid dehydrogenase